MPLSEPTHYENGKFSYFHQNLASKVSEASREPVLISMIMARLVVDPKMVEISYAPLNKDVDENGHKYIGAYLIHLGRDWFDYRGQVVAAMQETALRASKSLEGFSENQPSGSIVQDLLLIWQLEPDYEYDESYCFSVNISLGPVKSTK